MAKIYTRDQDRIGRRQSITPEGYLLCEEVPIAACNGTLLYADGEIEGISAKDGMVRVYRDPKDILTERTIASFNGKPVVISHNGGEINPKNFTDHAVGIVMNSRVGEGDLDDCIVADFLIYDQRAINLIRGKRNPEVSAGYDADYEELSLGKARQFNVFGNHVAIVPQGRCGPRCSIGDSKMAKQPAKQAARRRVVLTPKARRLMAFDAASLKLRKALTLDDGEAIEEAMAAVQEASELDDGDRDNSPGHEEGTGDPGDIISDGTGTNITVNINGGGGGEAAAKPGVTTDDDPLLGAPDPEAEAVPPWAQQLMARITKIEAAVGLADTSDDNDDGGVPDNEEAPLGDPDDGDDDMTKDKKPMTLDSAALRTMHTDVISKAEVLVPGIRMMTLDAKATRGQTFDSICQFRTKVLDRALENAALAAVIEPVLGGKKVSAMTCDEATMAFNGAHALISAINNGVGQRSFSGTREVVAPKGTKLTPKEINERNRKAHGLPV